MMNKWLAGLFLAFLCASFSFSQTSKRQTEAKWEFMEVSWASGQCRVRDFERRCRKYNYVTSGVLVEAPDSLEWMSESGWELVGMTASEGYQSLFFKRRYDRTRTEREIDWLEKQLDKVEGTVGNTNLIDLDSIESRQKLAEFNKNEAAQLTAALRQIKNLPLSVIEVKSNAIDLKNPRLAADVVLDATAVLLKNGSEYRASEVDDYFNAAAKQIIGDLKMITDYRERKSARAISSGVQIPKSGGIATNYNEIILRISVVLTRQGKRNIVAQNWIAGKLPKKSQ